MSDGPPPPSPFGPGGFDLSQLFTFLQQPGPLHRDLARQVARMLASGGTTPVPIDPATRSALLELCHVAQMHVSEATGLSAVLAVPAEVVDRPGLAERFLDGLEPVLVALAARLTPSPDEVAGMGEPDDDDGPSLDILAGVMPALAPILLGLQAGTMAGNLAQRLLGSYDLPLPLSGAPRIVLAGPNVDAFRAEWELPAADFHFVLALHEATHAAIRTVPWVAAQIVDLAVAFVDGYRVDPGAVEQRFGTFDLTDMSSIEGLLADPEALLGAMRTPAQDRALQALHTFGAVVAGYADHVVARVGAPLIPEVGRVQEAVRRHRVVLGEAERFIERLLGMELTREHYDRGRAFCDGVVERGGPEALNRLWDDAAMAPTPNELEAPGLWLARIELPADQ
jgi:putative hydrolase